jgi:hypothetical protein
VYDLRVPSFRDFKRGEPVLYGGAEEPARAIEREPFRHAG